MGKVRKSARFVLFIIATVLFLYSAYKVFDYHAESQANATLNAYLIEQAVSTTSAPESTTETDIKEVETAPIFVDFENLKNQNDDIIGWLYSEGTPINYPVLQSDDNDYYLRRLVNGGWNIAGSLFVDYRNDLDGKDWNTIIYGHNMKNDSMFGTLTLYSGQDYYEQHPVIYFLTPEADYKIEIVAGFVTSSDSALYNVYLSETERTSLYEEIFSSSDFKSYKQSLDENIQLLTLSTCSYEYETARYVVIGVMIPIEKQTDANICQNNWKD